jgi:hypothetical protein
MAPPRFLAFFTLLGVFLWPVLAHSQTFKISGRIVDSETLEPLPYTHIFIDQTTIGAVSDFNGEYVIEHLTNGEYKLVYSFVGYELYYNVVSINSKDARYSARLVPQKEELQNVEIKGTRDKEWESQLRQFNRVFFGDNALAVNCKILNPWVLEFDYDIKKKKFEATATAPLEIENRALGYSIVCNLLGFTFDKNLYRIKGLYKFDELNTLDPKEAIRWTRNRRQAYQNSLRFLMKSIVEHHANENGLGLYLDNRPAVYTSHTGLFSIELEKNNVTPTDLSKYITPTGQPGFYKLNLDKRIEVHHTTQFARNKVYRDLPYPVSWIEIENESLIIGDNGVILNNENVVTSGELNSNRIATMLPLNYSPGSMVVVNYLTKRSEAKRLQERVYLQTDKSVYYPGEQIWFKAHMNYANQSVQDSLSQVLYVDMIDESSKLIHSKIIQLDSFGGRGSFLIPKQFKSGGYFLRAYTRWMQNYGPNVIDYTPLVISSTSEKIVINSNTLLSSSNDFIWDDSLPDADSSILLIALDSMLNHELANCAISISPIEEVINSMVASIRTALVFDEDLPDGSLPDFIYPVEYGFSLRGKLIHPKKQFVQGEMTAIRGSMDSLYTFRTDKRGNFAIEGLTFQDTINFSFQARNRKGKIFGKTSVLPRESPAIALKSTKSNFKLDTIALSTPVELIKPSADSVAPTSVVIRESIEKASHYADYILTTEDLEKLPAGQSITAALQGRVPGLKYDFSGRSLSFRGNGVAGDKSNEPLFVIDGLPMFPQQSEPKPSREVSTMRQPQQGQASKGNSQNAQESQALPQEANISKAQVQPAQVQSTGSVTETISHITVSNVSRVEVTTRMDLRYGSLGANGVVAIYTKKVQGKSGEIKPFDIFKVEGFSISQPFSRAINYSGNPFSDYTPTWYWNPDVQISSRQFAIIKFPVLPKGVVFRVNIAGVTKAGVPVAASFLLNGRSPKSLNASLDQHQK